MMMAMEYGTMSARSEGVDIDGVVLRIPKRDDGGGDGSDTCGAIQIYLSFTSPRRLTPFWCNTKCGWQAGAVIVLV